MDLIEPEDDEAAETFEEFCHLCEKGLYGSVNETMMSNPRAETVWNNQRRESSMATPLCIAACWGHSGVVEVLLSSDANPMLRMRGCKADWCRHGYPTEPNKPCPGFLNPEHPDDLGDSALQIAKNRSYMRIIELIKCHIFNCVNHPECVQYKQQCPDDFDDICREPPLDEPLLLTPGPVSKGSLLGGDPPPPWPLKHHGQAFRAAAEGDISLVKRIVREWREAKELEDEDEIIEEIAVEAKTEDPVLVRHPITRETLLHVAAKQSNSAMVKFLIEAGADCSANDKWSASPFWHACEYGRHDNALLLASKLTVAELRRHQGRHGNTPANAAAANKHMELASWINLEIARRFKQGNK